MRGRPVRQIEHDLVDVAPAPPFRRIIGLDDRMPRRMKVLRRVPVRRLVATTDMATGPADPEVQPGGIQLQAFLAARRARNDVADRQEMFADYRHDILRTPLP